MTRDDWPRLLAAYTLEMRARGHSRETLRTRRSYLDRWTKTHEPVVTRAELVAWLAHPSWAPGTRKSAQGALRSFYGWMVDAGHLEHSPAACLRPVRVPRGLPRPASEAQVEAGCRADDPDTALMVRLAAELGLRRSEIAGLRGQDVTPWGLHVHGKGGKDRLIPLPADLRWELEQRPRGWVFPGRFTGHVHPSTVQKKVRAAAGVATHAHRHRFGTRAYAGTRDLRAVQQLMGHASPETTQVYVEITGDGLTAAVAAAARRAA